METGHTPLLTVHLKMAAPGSNPLTSVAGESGEEMEALPETSDHAPVPVTGDNALRLATGLEIQIV